MKKKSRKHNPEKIVKSFLIGSFYEFDVEDPLKDFPAITNTSYGHTNPIKRILMFQNLPRLNEMFNIMRLKWKTTVKVEFRSSSEGYYRIAEIVWHGYLAEAEGAYQESIEDIFGRANMSHYVICHVKVEVVGLDGIKDKDFTISKAETA